MKTTRVGQYLINSVLPEEYQDENRLITDESLTTLLTRMSSEVPPDEYRVILRDLFKVGAEVGYYEGSSFSLADLRAPAGVSKQRDILKKKVDTLLNSNLPQDQKDTKVINLVADAMPVIEAAMLKETAAAGSGFSKQIASRTRGKAADLRSLILGDMLMSGADGKTVPIPILQGYAEGVSPAEYWIGAHGTRKGISDVKLATADAGFLCLAANTKVRMADGSVKAICAVEVGDVVVGADISGNTFPVPVTAVFENGDRVVNNYVFKTPDAKFVIRATADHKVLTEIGGETTFDEVVTRKLSLRMSKAYDYQDDDTIPHPGIMSLVHNWREYGAVAAFNTTNTIPTPDQALTWPSATAKAAITMLLSVDGGTTLSTEFDTGTRGLLFPRGYKAEIEHEDDVSELDMETAALTGRIREFTEARLLERRIATGRVKHTSEKSSYRDNAPILDIIHELMAIRFGIRGEFLERGVLYTREQADALRAHALDTDASAVYSETAAFEQVDVAGDGDGVTEPTFDIEVDHEDHLFVLDNGAIVSNSKKIKHMGHRQVVTEADCGTRRWQQVKGNDSENIGALLATAVAGHEPGTPITARMLKDFGGEDIQVRSTLTCQAPEGVCAACSGIRERGTLPRIGDNVGMPAAQAVGEKVTQKALSSKHSAGRTDGIEKQFVSGFNLADQLMNVPKSFKDAATLATVDGTVSEIRPAPQGGTYIVVDDKEHYLADKLDAKVAVGDVLEAGEPLSDGIINPAEYIKYRGLGETRALFVKQLTEATGVNRRNAELLTRGFVNYVKIDEPDVLPNTAPEEVVAYNTMVRDWKPRTGHKRMVPMAAKGMYLDEEVGPYSIGTRITPRIVKGLKDSGYRDQITVHAEPPPFHPVMIPSLRGLSHAGDWQERLGGYYLKDSILGAAEKGMTSDLHSTSYIPPMLRGKGFGDTLEDNAKY